MAEDTENEEKSDYYNLGPDNMLAAVESLGLRCDGRFLALNSYENRVYQVGIEDSKPVIAKFYRPGRWSEAQILEEHDFADTLAEQEIPVVAPWKDDKGCSLHRFAGFRFALFPRHGGRTPDLEDPDHREWLGRFIARIHNVGAARPFQHRPALDIQSFGTASVAFVKSSGFIPDYIEEAYDSLTRDLLSEIQAAFERAGQVNPIRLHGDCHPGNLLWTDDGPHFVDLDDARSGPAIQDLWMLLSGDRAEMTHQLGDFLAGYEDFREFEPREMHLMEALRTLRILHYAAWLARRWDDPAFPMAFPWFNTPRYWEEHILALREQAALIQEPPLPV